MPNLNPSYYYVLDAYTAAGTLTSAVRHGTAKGVTLANSTVYYFPLNGDLVPGSVLLTSVQLKWAAAVDADFTIEASLFPKKLDGGPNGVADITDVSTTAGDWLQINPSDAYVPVSGSGNSVTALTISAGGSAAGGALIDIGNLGALRLRLKADVTTGGLLRVAARGKGAHG